MKGVLCMIAINFSTARGRLKDFCDRVTERGETVIVTRKAERNVVIISEDRFNELEKAERNAAYLGKLERGLEQVRAGLGIVKTMEELEAMADYLYWQSEDKKTVKRINKLLQELQRDGAVQGIGKAELLRKIKGMSKRIDETNRLVYTVENDSIIVLSCRGHYED